MEHGGLNRVGSAKEGEWPMACTKKEMNDRDKVDGSDLDSGGSTKASGNRHAFSDKLAKKLKQVSVTILRNDEHVE